MKGLIDQYNRQIKYLRLSVTDRCDLRCFYCMPNRFQDFEEPESWLTFDEIERVVAAFARLGVSSIRITGGEPLVRKDLPDLVHSLSDIQGINDLSLSTNAVRLDKLALPLKNAGVNRINVSLDSLKPQKFNQITQGKLDKVLRGLNAAQQAGFNPVKINMVVMKGVNDDEIEAIVDFCIDKGFTLRFIETMPVGDTGREAVEKYLSLAVVEKQLSEKYQLIPAVMPGAGPARYMRIADTDVKIGFITPLSQHFCETCNRVRLSVDGTLYLCLGDEHKYPLRPLLRKGISDDGLCNALVEAIELKPHKHEFIEKPTKVVRFMSMTGG